jgi:DNA-binding NtrC family response regulator
MMLTRNAVLIIEDDPHVNHLLGRSLRRAGFPVEQAFSAQQAVVMLEENDFSVVLTDLNLDTTSAIALLQPFHSRFETARTVLIAVTGDASFRMLSTEEQDAYGIDFFLPKPVSPMDVIQLVERFVTRPSNHLMTNIYDKLL